jgi:2'-5' RNA ligase
MENKFLCVMACYDETTEKHLAGLQQKLYDRGYIGEHTKNLPQHITLGTFEVDREEEIKELVREVSQRTEAFKVTFNHVGVFGGAKVLFVAPDSNQNLLKLKQSFGDCYDWTPHTTMLIDQSDKIYEALPIIMEDFRAFEGKITSLHLYEFWPTRWISTEWCTQ